MPGMKGRPRWQSVVLSTLHCGAGCTLADIVGEWFLFFVPVAIGGSILAGTWVVDYLLALAFGIGFQYAAIRGMERTLPRGEAIRRAAKADILSLTAWQAGMYGWMAVAIFALNGGEAMPPHLVRILVLDAGRHGMRIPRGAARKYPPDPGRYKKGM